MISFVQEPSTLRIFLKLLMWLKILSLTIVCWEKNGIFHVLRIFYFSTRICRSWLICIQIQTWFANPPHTFTPLFRKNTCYNYIVFFFVKHQKGFKNDILIKRKYYYLLVSNKRNRSIHCKRAYDKKKSFLNGRHREGCYPFKDEVI